MINLDLAKHQRLSQETIEEIKKLHIVRDSLVKNMKIALNDEELRNLFYQWKVNAFDLQKLWGFPMSNAFHTDYLLPGCTCPKMDNAELYGTLYRIYDAECPLHLDIVESKNGGVLGSSKCNSNGTFVSTSIP